MTPKRLLVTRQMPAPVLELAQRHFEVTVRPKDTIPPLTELRRSLRDYDAILCTLGDKYNDQVLTSVAAPRARLLANFGAGYDHIDVAAATARGISVTNTPGAVTDSTADIAVALILMTARRLGEGERVLRSRRWKGWRPTQLLGTHVSGKRLGIVGFGSIGAAVARRCHFGFGMEIVFYNRSIIHSLSVPARQTVLEEVLQSDFVLLAVPGGPSTHQMADAAFLSRMKPSGILINVARGEVVHEEALVQALERRQIRGAGLDVFEFEPRVNSALVKMENVTLLPHLGTACSEVRERMGFMALDNLIALQEGRPLPNQVIPARYNTKELPI
jgi:lactate dehydrogenase-like 2-hydroxyacid dehydrogenase